MSKIQEDITKEYEKFNPEMSSKGIRFYLNQEHMDEFFLYGIVTFGLNPYELNCENCFNPRLKNIRISFNLMDDVFDVFEYEFKITHMGTEAFPIVGNGVRRFTTYNNIYEIFTLNKTEAANPENVHRSPFANYMLTLTETSYAKCDMLQSGASEKCRYQQRTKITDLAINFDIEFTPNFPDITCLN